MLDIGWSELLLIALVALIVMGPEDLPKVMHTLGTWMHKIRLHLFSMKQTLQAAGYEQEIAQLKKELLEKERAPQHPSTPEAMEKDQESETKP